MAMCYAKMGCDVNYLSQPHVVQLTYGTCNLPVLSYPTWYMLHYVIYSEMNESMGTSSTALSCFVKYVFYICLA
jgi:hypothetical protein